MTRETSYAGHHYRDSDVAEVMTDVIDTRIKVDLLDRLIWKVHDEWECQ